MANIDVTREVINRLDEWVNALARPLLPLVATREPTGDYRLQFREEGPPALLVGKLVRAVSGIRAALVLADSGFITEAGALLRIVSDFCTEVDAVSHAVHSGDTPKAVTEFVQQYFVPKPRTPEENEAAKKTRYVTREELLKVHVRRTQGTDIDGDHFRRLKRYLNVAFDAYVHGAYETTMELFDPKVGVFLMSGHPSADRRSEFHDAIAGKLHEVVVAIGLTAAALGAKTVHAQANEAREALDAEEDYSDVIARHSARDTPE
jgi:hypothetical protein